jgi:hypothetical protein
MCAGTGAGEDGRHGSFTCPSLAALGSVLSVVLLCPVVARMLTSFAPDEAAPGKNCSTVASVRWYEDRVGDVNTLSFPIGSAEAVLLPALLLAPLARLARGGVAEAPGIGTAGPCPVALPSSFPSPVTRSASDARKAFPVPTELPLPWSELTVLMVLE